MDISKTALKLMIFSFVIIISSTYSYIATENYCCSNHTLLNENYTCSDGSNITLQCSWKMPLDPVKYSYKQYSIDDNTGELTTGYFHIENDSHYCINDVKSNGSVYEIAMVCLEEFSFSDDSPSIAWIYFIRIMQILSSICLLITAIVYYFLPELQNTEGHCVFHFSINMCLNYFFWSIVMDSKTIFPLHICITYAYFSYYCLLSGFFWMNLLSFHMWKNSKSWNSEDGKELEIYKIIGYGIPAIIIVSSLISAHIEGIYDTSELTCWTHERRLLGLYLGGPIVILYILNLFYLFDTGRRLWSTVGQTNLTPLKSVKYRCWLYIKLMTITGFFWGLQMFTGLFEMSYFTLELALSVLANSQGVFVLLVMVIVRKRALRGIARRKYFGYQVFPQKWTNMADSETEEAPLDIHQNTNHHENENNIV